MRDGQSQVCETIAPRSAVPRAAVESPGGRIRMSGLARFIARHERGFGDRIRW